MATDNLNSRVESFIKWYEKEVILPSDKPINKRIASAKMRDFIEKMAVWYEMAYPTREIIDGKAAPTLDLTFFINTLGAYEKKLFMAPGREFGIDNGLCLEIRAKMFDCVMYRLLERASNKLGVRRALAFAQQYGCDISVPMIYGLSSKDLDTHDLVQKYLSLGGSDKIECFDGYLTREQADDELSKFTLESYLKELPNTQEIPSQETFKR